MNIKEELKKSIAKAFESGAQCVLGWGAGPDCLSCTPLFMRSPEDVDNFEVGPLAVHNLALFLPELKGKKVGIVVKGCDSRSVGQLLAEKLINREDVTIIGFPCKGVIDKKKVAKAVEGTVELEEVRSVSFGGEEVVLNFPEDEIKLPLAGVLADKCSRCEFPNAVISDVFTGGKEELGRIDKYADLDVFESMSLQERMAFWEKEMSRCISCYACRNACPLCVCRDQCIAQSRNPKWVSQGDGLREKMFFQIIHASHLAGRCTGCGECERACPVGIPVLLLKRAFSRGIEQLFFYKAGIDPGATPPLMTFAVDEAEIKEKVWK